MTPGSISLQVGTTQQFRATGSYSDGSNQDLTAAVSWSTSDSSVATISNDTGSQGLATIVGSGTATITAKGSLSATGTLTASSPVVVSIIPRFSALTVTQSQQFQAEVQGTSNTNVTWSVDGVAGGSAAVGTISTTGLYASPAVKGSHTISATSQADLGKSDGVTAVVQDYPGNFTYHNDNARTGQNLDEAVLTLQSVNSTQFGKLFSYPVDGQIYAQPLYVANVEIPGQGSHNVVYVATEHNSVYAFEADRKTAGPLWQVSFISSAAGVTTVPCADEPDACNFFGPEVGITGTPVIDPTSGTLYVSAFTKENGTYVHRLHALEITTGTEKFGGPAKIQGAVSGSGDGSDGHNVTFDPFYHLQRPGLLLTNGVVYIAFGSFADFRPYHGWLFGYDAHTLHQAAILNTTPNGDSAAIWQSGGAPAADDNGNVFLMTGNGTFDGNSGGQDFGDSFLKLLPAGANLSVIDYFTPFNQSTLQAGDTDLGSGGPLLLPDQLTSPSHLLVGAGKEGAIYLLDRDHMGGVHSGDDSQIIQSIQHAIGGDSEDRNFSTPALWKNNLYWQGVDDVLKVFRLGNGRLSAEPVALSTTTFGFPGATPSISANQSSGSIVWTLEAVTHVSGGDYQSAGPAVLHAYDASNVSRELYNSTQAGSRDVLGLSVKFAVPTIANGRVYIGTVGELDVFGFLAVSSQQVTGRLAHISIGQNTTRRGVNSNNQNLRVRPR